MELAFGPRHPALHGLLRLRLRVDDERIVECRPVIGHLHRGLEKLFESQLFAAGVAAAGHLDYLGSAGALAYAGAVERLLRIAPPPRARLLRVLLAELGRVSSHLHAVGSHASDLGFAAPLAAALRERERIVRLLRRAPELVPGGFAAEPPAGWLERCRELAEALPRGLEEIDGLLTGNRLWKKRTAGLGVLAPELAVDLGVTGPALRACGLPRDLRRDLPYEAYGELDFEVAVGENGDAYDRCRVRIEEMRQSARIVLQALDRLPEEPAPPPPARSSLPGGEVYHGVEGPRGETGVYLVGDGTSRPYRCHARTPSFAHLQALPEICRGEPVADLLALIGTLDIALEEVDR